MYSEAQWLAELPQDTGPTIPAPVPEPDERAIDAFMSWRFLHLAVWLLERRSHPGFADWEADMRDLLDHIRFHLSDAG
jgi:hypothetical protein